MAKKKSKPDVGILKSQKDVADYFGVSSRMVNKWMKRDDPMPGSRGAYVIDEIKAWRDRTFEKGKDQQAVVITDSKPKSATKSKSEKGGSLSRELLQAKTDKEKALAKQNEIKAMRMDDEFIPITDVNSWAAEFFLIIRKELTQIPIDMFASAPDEHRKIYQPDLAARMEIALNYFTDCVERVEDLRE